MKTQVEKALEKSMGENNIYQRMLNIMEDVKYIQKEDKKVNNQYRFVSHDAVTAKIRTALILRGVIALPTVDKYERDGNLTSCSLTMKFVNVDKPEDFVEIKTFGYGVDNQDKGPGKAMSYAVKYAFLKAFCLETGDDPERDNIEAVSKMSEAKVDEMIMGLPTALTSTIQRLIKEERTTSGDMRELVTDTKGDPMLVSSFIEEKFAVNIAFPEDTATVNTKAAQQLLTPDDLY